MMKFSRAVEYALEGLVYMAQHGGNRPLASHITAQARGIPELFLLKLLKPLVSAGVLRSVKGPNGGYRLARRPQDISLLEVVEAVDGPLQGQVSFEGEGSGGLEKRLRAICDEAAGLVRRQYARVRLSDLATTSSGGRAQKAAGRRVSR